MTKRWPILPVELHPMVGFPANRTPPWFVLVVLFSWAFFASTTGACVICFPYPKTTLADILLESKTVIMARERTDKPYSFYAVDVLKGTIDGSDINAFVDSTSRRMLKHNSDGVLVFTLQYEGQDWQYTAYADTEYQQFVRSIIEQSSRWQGFEGDRNRIDFFAERLNHGNQFINAEAYLEVGRAPYASIKRIADNVPRQKIREFLNKWQLIEWHSLYILMLGQSRHPDDIAYIREKLKAAAEYRFEKNLAAWVTAFIETNPETGVEDIEKLYFNDKNRTPDELQEVCKGLSVLGSEGGFRVAPELVERRHRIVRSYGTLLENHPQMAGLVARDLTTWRIRALVDQLTQIKENESALDPDTKMAINYYLSISQRFLRIEAAH
jgi:hypothetical protein